MLLLLIFAISCNTTFAQVQDGWDEWQKTSCYSNISFRLKHEGKRGEQHVWQVQFKNDYNSLISFNYHISETSGQYDTTTHRKTLNKAALSEPLEVFTAGEDIFLLVDKVSLSPYPKDYINCDTR
ncbi:hypothetical protein Q765_18685 [Flavobacterium rivuli WB 3.3-2 = DSM 21788]|uniref:Uncharacterized protein n=2 Tax=Flavobacterium rivuli TaxID=498301 RepID=A0A0A2M0P0_9FLAO|nr:hypothetical protein Q765_18685 [Flavobacterium rivuli WB 3.3-2 = DSM 21788]